MYVVVFNSSSAPVPIDDEGRVVYPHDWAAADEDSEVVQQQIRAGHLRIIEVESVSRSGTNPAVIMAKEQVDAMNQALQPQEADEESADPEESEEKPVVRKTTKKK